MATTNHLTIGQVEALLPRLLAAKEAVENAKEFYDSLCDEMAAIIGEPNSVKTDWGNVTLVRGRRSVKCNKLINAKITQIKEEALLSGMATESYGKNYIAVRQS